MERPDVKPAAPEPVQREAGGSLSRQMINTKTAVPNAGSKLVSRAVFCLEGEVLMRPLTLVVAPGGYGKTSVLAQWVERLRNRGVVAAWVSLDEYDNDATLFLAYVARAIAASGGMVPAGFMAQLEAGSVAPDALVAALVNSVMADMRPVALFLDDLHLVRNPQVLDVLARLLRSAPPNLHIVIASRERPAALIGRNRTRFDILELVADDLRLTGVEIAGFLEQIGIRKPTKDAIDALEDCSEGWIAGLKLAATVSRGSCDALINALRSRRSGVAEFFAHDVIALQPENVQDFLIKTAILGRFTADLAMHVTGHRDASDIIHRLENSGLFIFSLDGSGEWFRYHHLFSEFLLGQLRAQFPGLEKTLHLRACQWLSSKSHLEEAFAHAMKGGDLFEAASMLDRYCSNEFCEGRLSSLIAMADTLPDAVLSQFPRLLLTKAWTHIVHWQFNEAVPLIERAETTIDRRHRTDPPGNRDLIEMDALLLHRKMLMARFRDRLFDVRSLCDELLTGPTITDTDLLGVIFDTLIHVETDQFDFTRVNYLERETMRHLESRNRVYIKIWHKATIGRARLLEGDTEAAIQACCEGIAYAEALTPGDSTFASIPGVILAEILYHRNKIEQARELCQRYWKGASTIGFPEQLISSKLVRARVLRLDGAHARSREVLEEGMRQAQARRFERLQIYMAQDLVTDLLTQGALEEARELYERVVPLRGRTDVLPRHKADTKRERIALVWVRFAIAEGRLADARGVASRWRDFARKSGAALSVTRWSLLLVVICLQDGEERAAMREVKCALAYASRGRFIRLFLDMGPPVAGLLRQLVHSSSQDLHHTVVLAREILGLKQPEGVQVPPQTVVPVPSDMRQTPRDTGIHGALGARELELLRHLSAGLTNREIGDVMGMTEGTVKWYLQQVYDKLGVRRRQLALEKARSMGIVM